MFPDVNVRRKDLLIDECDANMLDMILCKNTKKLNLGNLSFRFFAEHLRSIMLPHFRYDDQT